MKLLKGSLICILSVAVCIQAESTIIKNITFYQGSATEKKQQDILIKGQKIIKIGKQLSTDKENVRVIDGSNLFASAGLISLSSSLGLNEIAAESSTRDDSSAFYGPGFSIAAAINSRSPHFAYNLSMGLTHSISHPIASRAQIPNEKKLGKEFWGLASFLSTHNQLDKLIKKDIALLFNMGPGSDSRAAKLLMLEDALAESRSFWVRNAWKASAFGFNTRDLKALQQVSKKKIPLYILVNDAVSMQTLIKLKKKLKIEMVFVGASEAHLIAKELAKAKIPVLIDPRDNIPNNFDTLATHLENAKVLQQASVQFAFISTSNNQGPHIIRQAAGNAVANGLAHSAALAAISYRAAEIAGIQKLGKIEETYEATLVLWDGDPLELSSYPKHVFIAGKEQNLNSRAKALLKRYLSKEKLPLQYR